MDGGWGWRDEASASSHHARRGERFVSPRETRRALRDSIFENRREAYRIRRATRCVRSGLSWSPERPSVDLAAGSCGAGAIQCRSPSVRVSHRLTRLAEPKAPPAAPPADARSLGVEQPSLVRDHAADAERAQPGEPARIVDGPDEQLGAAAGDGRDEALGD